MGTLNQSIKLAPLPGWEFNVFLFRVFWSKGRCGGKKNLSILLLSTKKKKRSIKKNSYFFRLTNVELHACLKQVYIFIVEYTPCNPLWELLIAYLHGEQASW